MTELEKIKQLEFDCFLLRQIADNAKKKNEYIVTVLEKISPIMDALIDRTPSGEERNNLCDLNIEIKTILL